MTWRMEEDVSAGDVADDWTVRRVTWQGDWTYESRRGKARGPISS
jgi:hypothetical protein